MIRNTNTPPPHIEFRMFRQEQSLHTTHTMRKNATIILYIHCNHMFVCVYVSVSVCKYYICPSSLFKAAPYDLVRISVKRVFILFYFCVLVFFRQSQGTAATASQIVGVVSLKLQYYISFRWYNDFFFLKRLYLVYYIPTTRNDWKHRTQVCKVLIL